jgi:hypothetical protein
MSNRCTFNLFTAAERSANWEVRKGEDRRALLAIIFEANHACVHPLNHNYVADISDKERLEYWARSNGLLSSADERTLRGY